jgi:hypothetical protein
MLRETAGDSTHIWGTLRGHCGRDGVDLERRTHSTSRNRRIERLCEEAGGIA